MSPGGHAVQALPSLPHDVVVLPGSHVPEPLQHPAGQVIALQGAGWQTPPLQLSPEGHAMQVAPPLPHALVLLPISQKPRASQQPVGHVFASQTGPMHMPAGQESPGGHGRHAWPPFPHAVVLSPGSHTPRPSQHPVGQLDALQVTP